MMLPEWSSPHMGGLPQSDADGQGTPTDRLLEADSVPYDLLCTICLGVVSNDAVQTPCGHMYCRGCIHSSLRRQAVCPQDRIPLAHSQLKLVRETNPIVRRIWGAIKVRCLFAEKGECKWTGNLGDSSAHEARCARRLGSPRDLRIKELDKKLAHAEARLVAAVAEQQEALRRSGHLEQELKRRAYEFEDELKRRTFETQARFEELAADGQKRERSMADLTQRCVAFNVENQRLANENARLGEAHDRLLSEREERESGAARHIKSLQAQLSAVARDGAAAADDFERRSSEYENRFQARERAMENVAERARGLEMKLDAVAGEARGAREELAAERMRMGEEVERSERARAQTENALYRAQRSLSEAEEHLHEDREERRSIVDRAEIAEAELERARRAAGDAEDALAENERRSREQLAAAAGGRPNSGTAPFDRAYKYDRNSVVRLAQLVSRDLEDRPAEISPNRVFSCIASCFDDLKRGWTDNPQNYAIDVRMLLSVASASTWFNEQQQQLLENWSREEGWSGHGAPPRNDPRNAPPHHGSPRPTR